MENSKIKGEELALEKCQKQIEYLSSSFGKNIDTDDIKQEAALAVLESLHRYDENKTKHSTFFSHRMRGQVMDLFRKQGRMGFTCLKRSGNNIMMEQVEERSKKEPTKIEYNFPDNIRKLFKLLSDDERKILHLKFIVGFNQAEIAKIFKLTEAAITYKLKAIYKKLRRTLLKEAQWEV